MIGFQSSQSVPPLPTQNQQQHPTSAAARLLTAHGTPADDDSATPSPTPGPNSPLFSPHSHAGQLEEIVRTMKREPTSVAPSIATSNQYQTLNHQNHHHSQQRHHSPLANHINLLNGTNLSAQLKASVIGRNTTSNEQNLSNSPNKMGLDVQQRHETNNNHNINNNSGSSGNKCSSPGYYSAAPSPSSSIASPVSSSGVSSAGSSLGAHQNSLATSGHHLNHQSPSISPASSLSVCIAPTSATGTTAPTTNTATTTQQEIKPTMKTTALQPTAIIASLQRLSPNCSLPNLLTYYPEAQNDGLAISWLHATNSRAKLTAALMSDKTIICGDISLAEMSRYPVPIMARPPLGASDITLENWLQEAGQAQKGIKLTFTSTRTVEPAFRVLARHSEQLRGPMILNADILTKPPINRPNNTNRQCHQQQQQQAVDAWTFLMLCRTRFPKSIISIGWCGGGGGGGASDEAADEEVGVNCSLVGDTLAPRMAAADSSSSGHPNSLAPDSMFELDIVLDHHHNQQAQSHSHHLNHLPLSSQAPPFSATTAAFISTNKGNLRNSSLPSVDCGVLYNSNNALVQQLAAASGLHHHHQRSSMSATNIVAVAASAAAAVAANQHHNSISNNNNSNNNNNNHNHHHRHQILSSTSTGSLSSSSGNSSGSPSPTSPIGHLNHSNHNNNHQTHRASHSTERLILAAAMASEHHHHHHHHQQQQQQNNQKLTAGSKSTGGWPAVAAAAMVAASNYQHLPLNLNINEAEPQHTSVLGDLAQKISSLQQQQQTGEDTMGNSLSNRLFNTNTSLTNATNQRSSPVAMSQSNTWHQHVNKKPALGVNHRPVINSNSPSPHSSSPKYARNTQNGSGSLLCVKATTCSQQQVSSAVNCGGGGGYTREMIDKMASLVKEYNLTQPVTFVVEARLIGHQTQSINELQRLLYQVGSNSTLTVVAQQDDLIGVDDLMTIRRNFAPGQVLYDLPNDLAASFRHELDLL